MPSVCPSSLSRPTSRSVWKAVNGFSLSLSLPHAHHLPKLTDKWGGARGGAHIFSWLWTSTSVGCFRTAQSATGAPLPSPAASTHLTYNELSECSLGIVPSVVASPRDNVVELPHLPPGAAQMNCSLVIESDVGQSRSICTSVA